MPMAKPHISVVSPVYKAENIVAELVRLLHENLSAITNDYEIILVNDASPDRSWEAITAECGKDRRVKGVALSRNFGQHYAIAAGLEFATGEWVVIMDCDLQDRPDEIPNLYRKAQDGYDVVYARRTNRQDNFFKRMSSKVFNAIFGYLSGVKMNNAANLAIYNSKVIAQYNKVNERDKTLSTAQMQYLGFKSCFIDVKHGVRHEGKSSYTFAKLLRLALSVTLTNSNKPLMLTVQFGFLVSLFSFGLALYNVVAKLTGIVQLAGYTSTIFSIWFVGGLIMFTLGIVGLYIGKVFDQVKGRPLFVVSDTQNIPNRTASTRHCVSAAERCGYNVNKQTNNLEDINF